MDQSQPIPTLRKALTINLDESRYGTFAEIGAGQEVARYFFQAGRASATIAKTMSAYDMIYSDEIYGKESSGRYVCESRLIKMLKKEYDLLERRLKPIRGDHTRFFAFANTVATSGVHGNHQCNGWMGVRFQTEPGGAFNDIVLHVRMLDRFRLQQQEALGILGVNLLYAAFHPPEKPPEFITLLTENLNSERIEIDMIRFSGPNFSHIDNRLMSVELVRQSLTNAVMFGADGNVLQVLDVVFKRDVFVQRGSFRPVTKVNIDILERGLNQFLKSSASREQKPVVLLEMTLHNLLSEGQLDKQDFLDRVDTLSALGYSVMISNFTLFYQLKAYFRRYTKGAIGIVIGASHLEKLFDEKFYADLGGGILEAFGQLFDPQTQMLVYPYVNEQAAVTAHRFRPAGQIQKLYEYLIENSKIVDIQGCDEAQISVNAEDVREQLRRGDGQWEQLVPASVVRLIKNRQLFGYGH